LTSLQAEIGSGTALLLTGKKMYFVPLSGRALNTANFLNIFFPYNL
jgi:hypothetical protein